MKASQPPSNFYEPLHPKDPRRYSLQTINTPTIIGFLFIFLPSIFNPLPLLTLSVFILPLFPTLFNSTLSPGAVMMVKTERSEAVAGTDSDGTDLLDSETDGSAPESLGEGTKKTLKSRRGTRSKSPTQVR